MGWSLASPTPTLPAVRPASLADDHVVVAVIDTGVNPYHAFFAAPALDAHPSTYLAGFPASATSLTLTVGGAYDTAIAADAAVWQGVQRSTYDAGTDAYTTRLYTFPGTRVVGGVSFGEFVATGETATGRRAILDDHSHGTRSAGLALGADLPVAEGNVLLVAVEVGQGDFATGIRWAARQPWIDALSVSLGTAANLPYPDSFLAPGGADEATREAVAAGKPVFFASGNGVSNVGLADRCSTYTSEYTGPAWVTNVGAAHDTLSPLAGEDRSDWHCVPVDAIARTNRYSPDGGTTTASARATGTSAATPNLAGHYAALLLKARRADLDVDRLEVLQHLLNASAPIRSRGVAIDSVEQGYGFVYANTMDRAWARLSTDASPVPRPELDAWWARDNAVRAQLWGESGLTQGPGPLPPPPVLPGPDLPQDDGGSGGDAGPDHAGAVPVAPRELVSGRLYAPDGSGDVDAYAFDAADGDTLTIRYLAACVAIQPPSGPVRELPCPSTSGLASVPLRQDGTWLVLVRGPAPHDYRFAFTLDGSAPPALEP